MPSYNSHLGLTCHLNITLNRVLCLISRNLELEELADFHSSQNFTILTIFSSFLFVWFAQHDSDP